MSELCANVLTPWVEFSVTKFSGTFLALIFRLLLLHPPWSFYYWSQTVWFLWFLPSIQGGPHTLAPRSWLLTASVLVRVRTKWDFWLACLLSFPTESVVTGSNTLFIWYTHFCKKIYPLRLPCLKMCETSVMEDSKLSLKWRLYLSFLCFSFLSFFF